MLCVGSAAPPFDCSAVVAGHLARLSWRQVHGDKTLVLLFDAIGGSAASPDPVIAAAAAAARLARSRARVAVVCRNDLDEMLGWVNRPASEGGPGELAVPLIVDPDGRVASLYGLADGGRVPQRGQFVIDPAGVIRQMAVSGFPAGASAEELLRAILASGFPAGAGIRN